MPVIAQTSKAVLYQEDFVLVKDERYFCDPIWYVYKVDQMGFWHWIDGKEGIVYHSLDEAKVEFLLEVI
jgi:hypothetical protein